MSFTNSSQYGTEGTGYGSDLNSIAWATWNGSRWDGITTSTTGSISSGTIFTTSAVSDFSNFYFTLGSTDASNNLPIDLVSFEGECIDNQANLEFIVASQVNNDYFTIERSKNILEWEEIGHINGGGTNNEEIIYKWTDYFPKSGYNYYKLSQTDIDGTTKSFDPIVINCDSKVEDYNIFPNPSANRISVEFELEFYQGDNIELVLRDLKGSIVKLERINLNRGYNYFEVGLNDIPKGIYLLEYKGTKNHIPERRVVKL